MDDYIGVAQDKGRLAQVLRNRLDSRMRRYRPADTVISADTGRVPITRVNYAGIFNDAMDEYRNNKLDQEASAAEAEAQGARRAAVQDAISSGDLSPSKMVALSDAGVDPDVLKLISPKSSGLGDSQIVQYGRDAAGMRALNKVRPGTFSEEEIAAAEREANRPRATGGSGGGGSKNEVSNKDIVMYGRTAAGMRALNKVKPGTFTDEEIAAAEQAAVKPKAGARGKGAVDPVESLKKWKDYETRLGQILADPASDEQLFSRDQQVFIPAAMKAGGGDNPGIGGAIMAQYAKSKKSPLAAEVDRMSAAMSFDTVKQLYPASNSDIALAQSLQATAGDSRENMTNYLEQLKLINRKMETGQYGTPAEEDAVDSEDDALINKYLME